MKEAGRAVCSCSCHILGANLRHQIAELMRFHLIHGQQVETPPDADYSIIISTAAPAALSLSCVHLLPSRPPAAAVVRYHTGEFYHEHYDNRVGGALTRAATIIIYLW